MLFQGDYIWIEPVSRREFDVAIGARVVSAEGRRIQVNFGLCLTKVKLISYEQHCISFDIHTLNYNIRLLSLKRNYKA